ncbi:hypothetical protein P7E15_17250 [Enterococcus gallinarum]|nr:hypothetical protein [Enterococcus gallinarum]
MNDHFYRSNKLCRKDNFMVGKNNKKLLELKSNPIIKKWRISRLKTGVASIVIFSGVLLSSTIFIPLHTVSAEETVTTTYYDQSKKRV